jgi:hypothetical protein
VFIKEPKVKHLALAVLFALSLGSAEAAAIASIAIAPPAPAVAHIYYELSTVPEPQVIAMMLLGLCLIGFRAHRITDEKFK